MRTYDQSDDELYLKSINANQILKNTMLDISDLFSRDNLLHFLRIAVLIYGYIVVRPFIEACFRRFMTSQETADKREKKKQKSSQKSLAEELLVDSEDAEYESDGPPGTRQEPKNSTSKGEWGGTIRKRQKAKFMEAWEEEQARLAEEEELRELEDILED